MRNLSKLGFIVSMIMGFWFAGVYIILFVIQFDTFGDSYIDVYEIKIVISIIIGLVAIIGVGAGFKRVGVGSIVCFVAGLSLFISAWVLYSPWYSNFIFALLTFYGLASGAPPELLLLIGGIICLIEWRKVDKDIKT